MRLYTIIYLVLTQINKQIQINITASILMQICLYVCKHYVYEQFSNIYVCTFDYIILCIYLFILFE